jgi:Heterokaryon incompatibility protein (HET)
LGIIPDSEEDKSAQISSMGNIYKNATLTIPEGSAAYSRQGFFQEYDRPCVAHIPILLSNGKIGSLRVQPKSRYYPDSWNSMEEPLSRRGWVLQEFLLSPRFDFLWSKGSKLEMPD